METLVDLLNDIFTAVQQNEGLVAQNFGGEGVLEMVGALQRECDTQGARILQRYMNHRQLVRLSKDIGAKRSASTGEGPLIDPIQVRALEHWQYLIRLIRLGLFFWMISDLEGW